ICGGQAGPLDDQVVALPERPPVQMRIARCRKVLGVEVSDEEIASIFNRLGLTHERDAETFVVTPPSYRFDIQIEEDLIEEVARVYGFERIPDLPPLARANMRAIPETVRSEHSLRHMVAAFDYQEVVNFSFVEEDWERNLSGNADPIRLLNPIASHMSVMRSSLIAGLLDRVQYNFNRKQSRIRLFELGRVFMRDTRVSDGPLEVAGVHQPLRLAGIAFGPALPEQWSVPARTVDFFDVKADVEALAAMPGRLRFESAQH